MNKGLDFKDELTKNDFRYISLLWVSVNQFFLVLLSKYLLRYQYTYHTTQVSYRYQVRVPYTLPTIKSCNQSWQKKIYIKFPGRITNHYAHNSPIIPEHLVGQD